MGQKIIVTTLQGNPPVLTEATVSDEQWKSPNKDWERTLGFVKLPVGYHPDADMELAERVVELWGGKIEDRRVGLQFLPGGAVA